MSLLIETADRLEAEFWQQFDGSDATSEIVFKLAKSVGDNHPDFDFVFQLFSEMAQTNILMQFQEKEFTPGQDLVRAVVYDHFFRELETRLNLPLNEARIRATFEAWEKANPVEGDTSEPT